MLSIGAGSLLDVVFIALVLYGPKIDGDRYTTQLKRLQLYKKEKESNDQELAQSKPDSRPCNLKAKQRIKHKVITTNGHNKENISLTE